MTSLDLGMISPRLRQTPTGLPNPPRKSRPGDEVVDKEADEEACRAAAMENLSRAVSQGVIPWRLGAIRKVAAEIERTQSAPVEPATDSRTERREAFTGVLEESEVSEEAVESQEAQEELEMYVADSPATERQDSTPGPLNNVRSLGEPIEWQTGEKRKKKGYNPRGQLTIDDYISGQLSDDDDEEPRASISGFFREAYGGTAIID